MRDINEFSITQAVQDSFQIEPDSRFRFLLDTFVQHLHDYVREVRLTHEEWMMVMNFLYECGKISNPERSEFILLSDVLGLSALVDMINSYGGGTPHSNLGPFYLPDAPERELGSDLAEGYDGVVLLTRGIVRDTLGRPIAGAIVDTWQADASGTYPIQEQKYGRDKYDLRGRLRTNEKGEYWYTTVMPRPYTVPYDGPVGDLLRAGKRHAWRTAHLHYMVSAEGYRPLVTEVFFENSEYLDSDAVFGVRRSLVVKLEPVRKDQVLDLPLKRRPDAQFTFDFVLAPEG
ncbi:dioxygenase [Meiothermus sp. CFH 77666]|uniref:dioxygenase family protein n=1 Tax=Meiothermus sp. CFH 77666 TaxID=2817942 RepID=UPI001AA04DF8|nr:hypothetical protein [Meiothermus sp. CFH 77666]